MRRSRAFASRSVRIAGFGAALTLALAGCGRSAPPAAKPAAAEPPPAPAATSAAANADPSHYSVEVVHTWPHARDAFTEGLVYDHGVFLESTGLNGRSSLRKVDPTSGRIVNQLDLSAEFFGEGMTVLDGRIYQLTWRSQRGFVYDLTTFALQREFHYEGEGWGLTTDGRQLIMSDGTNRLRFIDPATFQVVRTIDVFRAGQPLANLNELEWYRGTLLANVWQTSFLVQIDPADGRLLAVIDASGLLAPEDMQRGVDVLNGIAYDPAGDRLFVTGKNWPKLFEIRLKPW